MAGKIALLQARPTVGDLQGNSAILTQLVNSACNAGANLAVSTELMISGYPPRDLLLQPDFIAACEKVAMGFEAEIPVLIGCPLSANAQRHRPGNGVVRAGDISREVVRKQLLPTYDVFDEDRYFEPATGNLPVEFKGQKLGLTICEDAWNDAEFWRDRRYHQDPVAQLVEQDVDCLINISASPWHLGKGRMRREMLASLAAKSACPILYCNAVGGNDELVFDGRSLALNKNGQILAGGASFQED